MGSLMQEKSTRTRPSQLQEWLLVSLLALGGEATKKDALDKMYEIFGHLLTPIDLTPPDTRPNEPRWRNSTAYERIKLIDHGILKPKSQTGIWKLTELGFREANGLMKAYRTDFKGLSGTVEPSSEPTIHAVDDPIFSPKADTDYIVNLSGGEFRKSRRHETLVKDFGIFAQQKGFVSATNVHPIDLELRRGQASILVEAKALYEHDSTRAVREAFSQLFAYEYFLRKEAGVVKFALFDEPVGEEHIAFLEFYKVASAWRNVEGDGWEFSPLARSYFEP